MSFINRIPPPLIPCITRLKIKIVTLPEILKIIMPTKKEITQKFNTIMRPKILESTPMGSWKMEELSRKPVLDQKASIVVPPRSLDIIYSIH